jgi:adenylate cyclase
MAEQHTRRRLAAILMADVVGYSRLMQRDDDGTLAALKDRRREILRPLIAKHQGRIVNMVGDSALAAFGSAVNAVACGIELQDAMSASNAGLPPHKQIVLRVGINLGEVIAEGSALYGDGVNIAARIQSLSEPGAVYISAIVYAQVRGKIPLRYIDLGEHSLKNIDEPVRVYRVLNDGSATKIPNLPHVRSSKPKIAVLPFTNMSADQNQQYLSDGVSEDIITELSRYRELLVVARNISFQHRDRAVDVKRVGQELGVEYLVEGSVRKAGKRLRITAQLIDVTLGTHLWAERYDCGLDDVFAIQDEVTQTIAATLVGQVSRSGAQRARRRPTERWEAYDYYLQGRECALFHYEAAAAVPLLKRAIDLDPTFARAHAVLSFALVLCFFDDLADETLNAALQAAQTSLSLDENDAWSHLAMGFVCTFLRRFELAGIHHAKAVALNPNDAQAAFVNAHWLTRVGCTDQALREFDRARRLDPFMPDIYWEGRGIAFTQARRYQEAVDSISQMNKLRADNHYALASAYAHLGQIERAKFHAAEVRRLRPDYSERWVRLGEPYENPADIEHLVEGLRKAGLQE